LVYVGAACLLGLLLVVALGGDLGRAIALAAAILAVLTVSLGTETVGAALIGLAFLTAPVHKNLSLGASASLVDVLLAAGFVLLLPRILRGQHRISAVYAGGLVLITLFGTIGSVASPRPLESILTLLVWLAVILALPFGMLSWGPSDVAIRRLAWAFVAGQSLSFLYGVATGPFGGGRYAGYTPHPNYFAEGGLMAFALLLYLHHETRNRWLVWLGFAMSLGTMYLSGSRAAIVIAVGMIIVVPIVERSALAGYLLATAAALAVGLFGTLKSAATEGSALERLLGGDTGAAYSDKTRSEGLSDGIARFIQHPLTGSGLIDLRPVHNNLLEVAIGTGVFGAIGYLMVIWALTRGLLTNARLRRLCYAVPAGFLFGLTAPSLSDRSIWVAISLSIVVFGGGRGARDAEPGPPERGEPSAPPLLAPVMKELPR
jgi:hypothetical protein